MVTAGLAATADLLPATAGQDPLSPDTSACAGPASTPACASKSWGDCLAYRNPALCDAVGRPGMTFQEPELLPDGREHLGNKPWLRTVLEWDPPPIVSVREIAENRFAWIEVTPRFHSLYDPDRIVPALRGTHEVMYGWVTPERAYDTYSHFLRQEGDHWVITSWTWQYKINCDPEKFKDAPFCAYFIDIAPWGKWREEQWGPP